jgi:hypothetical protein
MKHARGHVKHSKYYYRTADFMQPASGVGVVLQIDDEMNSFPIELSNVVVNFHSCTNQTLLPASAGTGATF